MKHLIILLFLFYNVIYPQENQIAGKIVDVESYKPLSLANIVVENKTLPDGSQPGTTSDENGEFILSGPFDNNDFLIISYLGYKTLKIPISELSDKSNLIKMEDEVIRSQTVLVTGSIGKAGITPLSFSKIKHEDIENRYTTQDIPEFLSSLPSTTFYSENGNNIGYNYLSIRGFDQRRISVSINGIPQNDPEDHNVYWLDFPDLLASTELIQVQRGAGSGVIGYPAVGGSINIITSAFSDKPRTDLSISLGDYNTRKYSTNFSSGLINDKYSIYVKLSKLLSSGYRNYSWVDFNSYHVSAVRYDESLTTQINFFGGPISDGLAYTGLPKFTIEDKNQRRQNYSYWEASDNKYDYKLERRPDEIENFSQPHFELLNEYKFSDDVTINSALFLVLGKGFFDYDGSWSVFYDDYFRLSSNGFDSNFVPTNALIRAQVENKQFGWIPRISFKHTNGELVVGSEIRVHRSLHWGSINYAENLPPGVTKDYRYYQYRGAKDILNIFVHESFNVSERINLLAELQVAYHKYKLYEERYLNNDFSINNLFFNPRFGINYRLFPNQNIYLSFARVSREPRLKNYYDAAESSAGEIPQFEKKSDGNFNFDDPLVKPETLNDIEFGSSFISEKINLTANFFLMLFDDEIIKEGQVDRFGQPITGNADRTIHSGIEVTASVRLLNNIELLLNGTYSKNYINKGNTFISYNDPVTGNENVKALDISGNRISGFPEVIFNGILKVNIGGFYGNISAKYVGKFYSDNFEDNISSYLTLYPGFIDYSDNVVPSYFTADLYASYEIELNSYPKVIKIFGQVNNLFDNLYAAYAIGKEYFPAAERNFLAGIKVGL